MYFQKILICFIWTLLLVSSCSHGPMVMGNEGGSEPLNEQEALDYKKAINRCYKSGGTRIVKIEGNLRCF